MLTGRGRHAGTAVPGAGSRSALASPEAVWPGAAVTPIGVSATLAANEALTLRRRAGLRVLALAFGEAGLPVAVSLREALAAAGGRGGYGPVAGLTSLREAAAGYWQRRGVPTRPAQVVCGPGSKPLLFALLLAIGGDVAIPQPSWVTYAAQAALSGVRAWFVPTPPGEGGVPDPGLLAARVTAARAAGREVGSVVVTLPDNPTGTVARPATIRRLCETAADLGLTIISDEIYRDLMHDPAATLPSPASIDPGRTVVTTALSKNLALGGWRIGVARMPDGTAGATLRDRLLGIASEVWSTPPGPVQEAATYAFTEPQVLTSRVSASATLHARVAQAVAARLAAAGAQVPRPQAAFYVYPDFGPLREQLRVRHGVRTATDLATLLLDRYGVGVLPGSAFGDDANALRLRVATGQLYGANDDERESALTSADPLALPWISAALARLTEVLADLTGPRPAGSSLGALQ